MEASTNREKKEVRSGEKNRLTNDWAANERASGTRNMIFGLVWVVAGLVITLYIISRMQQGTNILLPLLAIIFGAVQFFKGLMTYFYEDDPEDLTEEEG